MRLVWGKTDISRYVRSNFSLGLLTTTYPDKLESGHEALESIRQLDQLNANLLGGCSHRLSDEKGFSVAFGYIVPCWYYLYDGCLEVANF